MIWVASILTLLADGQFEHARISESNLILELSTSTNSIYVIDAADELPGVWRETHLLAGTGSAVPITNEVTSSTRFFRARSFPRMMTLKPGSSASLNLALSNSTVQWSSEGEMPAGLSFANGLLSGTPTADAAEKSASGNYTNIVHLAGGARGSAELTYHVRLSFSQNIYPARPDGPSLGSICLKCHGSGFPPDFTPNAATIINQQAGSAEGACPDEWRYVVPGDLENSLIYQKVTVPPCGDRMPQGGPYLNQVQIDRLARWIAELQPGEMD